MRREVSKTVLRMGVVPTQREVSRRQLASPAGIDPLGLAVTLSACVKTTPQMTRFRDAQVCNKLVTYEIDDHRIQSDYKCTIGRQNAEGKNSTLGIAYAW